MSLSSRYYSDKTLNLDHILIVNRKWLIISVQINLINELVTLLMTFSVKSLEKAKSTGQFAVTGSVNSRTGTLSSFEESNSDNENDSEESREHITKKLKLGTD